MHELPRHDNPPKRGPARRCSSRIFPREDSRGTREHPDELSLLIKRFPGIEADSERRRPIWQKVPATKWTENNAFVEVAGNSGRVHERVDRCTLAYFFRLVRKKFRETTQGIEQDWR